MPYFGAHLSIAGGLHRAIDAATNLGIQTVQLFTSSPQSWPVHPSDDPNGEWISRPLEPDQVRLFRRKLRQSGLRFPTAHDSYLINLASPDETLYRRSIAAFLVELQRAETLGLLYLVTHPGAHLGSGEDPGLTRVAAALDEIHSRCPNYRVKILLETTAGQGTTLGHRFEHLASIRQKVGNPQRLGICLDTCHVFAAGYALAPEVEYRKTMRHLDKLVGLSSVHVFHLNDSLKPQGSRIDRHAHIGQGELGIEPFRLLVNDRRFRARPMILETPKEGPDGEDMDPINLQTLRDLLAGNLPSAS